MLYIRIKENTQQAKLFAQYVKTLPFVKVIDVKADKKSKLLAEIEEGLTEVKQMQEGKAKKKTLKQMLNDK